MDKSLIQKLRRFSLGIGLILLTYSIAGIQLDTPAKITPLGIPLVIKYPNLIGIVLFSASLYASFRYLYYAVLIGPSPREARKRLKKGLLPNSASSSPFIGEEEYFRKFPIEFHNWFPRVGKYKASFKSFSQGSVNELKVPWLVEVFCILEDIDYYSPIWVNVIAILFYIFYR